MRKWLAVLAASLAGCASSSDYGSDLTPPAADAGVFRDAGARTPAADAGASAPIDDAGTDDEFFGPDYDTALARCFNGEDDDDNGSADCADPSCRAHVPACCVGAGDAACCAEPEAIELPFADCLGNVETCEALTALAIPFGSPGPAIEAEGSRRVLVARGDTADSGLLVSAPIDLRAEAITITAKIATGGTPHQSTTDFIAVGLMDANGEDALVRVAPRVGLVVSGNRNDVGLLIAGELVMREPLTSDAFHEYTLTSRPGGAIELLRDGQLLGTATLPLDQELELVLYGRGSEGTTTDPPPARLERLRITKSACDVPAAMRASEPPLFPELDGSLADVRRVASPSLVRFTDVLGETQERIAIEIDGAIHLVHPSESGWVLTRPRNQPALAPSEWAERLAEPALRWTGSALELFFTAFDIDGKGHIARVRAAEGSEHFDWSDVDVLFAPGDGVASYSGAAPFTYAGDDYLALREEDAAGSRIVLHQLEPRRRLRVVREPSADLFAFDRDDVGTPSVLVTGDVIRLYFAGRRGSSSSIGVIVSPDAIHWTEPEGGALVLAAAGSGFDALGVMDPEPVIIGDTLHLFYTGLDGARARIGLAVGPAPPSGL